MRSCTFQQFLGGCDIHIKMFVSTAGEQKQLLFESANSVSVTCIHDYIIWTGTALAVPLAFISALVVL